MLVDDEGERARLIARLDVVLGPLGGVLRDGGVVSGAEDDLLLLDAVADRRASVESHVDGGHAEGDQHRTGNHTADLQDLPHVVPPFRFACDARVRRPQLCLSGARHKSSADEPQRHCGSFGGGRRAFGASSARAQA